MALRPISMADMLIALSALKPTTDEAKQGIARSLGFDYQPQPKPAEEEPKAEETAKKSDP